MPGMLWDEAVKLRQHQADMLRICSEIASGGRPKKQIDVFVTPGGGKSIIPVIAAATLIPAGFADKICWVAPRQSLQDQAERQFLEQWSRRLLDHDLKIRSSTNEYDPSRGTSGFVTTYQALAADSARTVAQEFECHKYILVADEIHHVALGERWHMALAPLVQRAQLFIPMSGSHYRADGKKIAFLRYREAISGEGVDTTPSDTVAVLTYTRQDALRERAIIPVHVEFKDGKAEWITRDGDSRSIASFDEAMTDSSDAVFTALHTNYAFELIDQGIAHFLGWKEVNSRAKILFVAPGIKVAKKYLEHIRESGIRKVLLATSEENREAQEAITRFKKVGEPGAVDALVTVAMAYEGMDVPPVTHVVGLTHIRSAPWIEQMVARATRHDRDAGPWHEQVAFLFVPDDPEMRDIIDRMVEEGAAVIVKTGDRKEQENRIGEEADSEGKSSRKIIPVAGMLTDGRSMNLGNRDVVTREEHAAISEILEKHQINGKIPHLTFKKAFEDYFSHKRSTQAQSSSPEPMIVTETEREDRIRKTISDHCLRHDRLKEWEFGETNRRVLERFDKPRARMTMEELRRVWAWIQETYPISEVS